MNLLNQLSALLDTLYKSLADGEIHSLNGDKLYYRSGDAGLKSLTIEYPDGTTNNNLDFYDAIELIVDGSK